MATMIFKRAVAKLRAQDWAAITIELFIVVLGVFIGVQASNLNEERADRARAQGYLERIEDDFDTDLANYRDRLRFWGRVSQFGSDGLRYAGSGESGGLTRWQLLLAYFQASQVAEFWTTSTTYDELKSAGELGLIRDIELRNSLATYYANSGNVVLTERPAYREHVRGIIPIDVQKYIWDRCYRSTRTGEQEMVACRSPIAEARAAQIVEKIATDTALMNQLRYWMSTMEVGRHIGRDQVALATQVRDAVRAEIAAR